MAKEKTYQTDIRRARKQQKRKKKLRRLISVTAIACILLAVVLTSEAWLPKLRDTIKGITGNDNSEIEVSSDTEFTIPIGKTNNSNIYAFGNKLALVTDTNVIVYDKAGKMLKSIQHKLANPIGTAGSDMLLLYDKGGYSLMAINAEGEVYDKMFTEQIILAKLGSADYAAVVTQTDKYAAYLTVYDKKGKDAFLWSNTQRVTDLTLNAAGDGCLVSCIKATAGELSSSVIALSFSQIEPVFSIDNIPAMLYDTVYSHDDSFWALSDTRLIHLKNNGEVISQYDFDTSLIASAMDPYSAVVAEKGVVSGSFDITIASSRNTDIKKHTIEGECIQLSCANDMIYLLTDDKMYIFSREGYITGEYKLAGDYSSFVVIDGNLYAKDYDNIYKLALNNEE